jgi:hypothetical protein
LAPEELRRVARGISGAPCALADTRVHLQVEQPRKQVLPIGRLVLEKARELVLRQDHRLREVIERQAEQFLNRRSHLLGALGEQHARTVGVDLFEKRFGCRRFAAADPNDACRPISVASDVERQRHPRFGLSQTHRATDDAIVVVPWDDPVEREAHRVDDRRLACARRPDEREEVESVEVEVDWLSKRRETLDVQRDRTHQASTPCSSSSCSREKRRSTLGSSMPCSSR